MKIKNIKINNYGNLENKEINLENKINIIYGKNESGKSTLLNYIKNIFYGISKNKNGKEISDYEKYKPWMKEEFSGKLSYELDNGENFEIVRDFHKKNPKVYNGNFEEVSKKYNIDKKDGVQFFYEQTKVDEMMFLSTIVSEQQEVRLDKQSQQILVQRIANLAGTGDDNISFKKVLDKLNKRQVDEIGTDRTQGKPINLVKNRMKEIEFVIKDIKSYQESKKQLEEKKEKLQEQISNLEVQNIVLKNLHKVELENDLERQKIYFNDKIKNELQEKIETLNEEKNKLIENKKIIQEKNNNKKINLENNSKNNIENNSEIIFKNKFENNKNENKNNLEKNKLNKKIKNNKKQKKYFILFFIFLIIFLLIEFFNFISLKNTVIYFSALGIIPIYFICHYLLKYVDKNKIKKQNYVENLNEQLNAQIEEEKLKNELNILDTKIENLDMQIMQYQKEQVKYIEETKNIQANIDEKIDLAIENIKRKCQEIDIDTLLDNIHLTDLSNQINEVQRNLNQNKLELNSILIEEKNILPELENMILLEEEYANLKEKLQDLQEENNAIILTKEYLMKAYEKMKNSVTPKFTENLSKNIEKISNGKYRKVSIHDDSGLVVENQFGDYISVDRLSIGTIDQLYLALRLSMIDEISEENMPIILDEAFAYYDESRLENILTFLSQELGNHQLIIFTCTYRERNILDKLQVPYNLVELS